MAVNRSGLSVTTVLTSASRRLTVRPRRTPHDAPTSDDRLAPCRPDGEEPACACLGARGAHGENEAGLPGRGGAGRDRRGAGRPARAWGGGAWWTWGGPRCVRGRQSVNHICPGGFTVVYVRRPAGTWALTARASGRPPGGSRGSFRTASGRCRGGAGRLGHRPGRTAAPTRGTTTATPPHGCRYQALEPPRTGPTALAGVPQPRGLWHVR